MPTGDVVLIDPIHPCAVAFSEAAGRRGIGTVCLWTGTNNRGGAFRFPQLRSSAVTAHHAVELDGPGLRRAADTLREQHDVLAVIPYAEPMVVPSVTLAHLLGLSWAQPEVMALFRDKHAMKRALAAQPDGPRVNRVALVEDVADVRRAMDDLGLDRVVLKPNDGFGNVDIGYVDRRTSDADVAALLEHAGGTMLLEERLDGAEYFVNGHVDATGRVEVTRVGASLRATVNGDPGVKLGDVSVTTDEPVFEQVAGYARHVLTTTGARRTPFHLECIVDDDGPCLVEVGARFMNSDPTVESWLHGTDVLEVALGHYLGDDEPPLRLDWRRYDAQVLGRVHGTCERAGRVARVRGVRRAEDRVGFLTWVHRPAVGDHVSATHDLFSNPWVALVAAPDRATWCDHAEALRATIELDVVRTGVRHPLLQARALAPVAGRLLRRGWSALTTR